MTYGVIINRVLMTKNNYKIMKIMKIRKIKIENVLYIALIAVMWWFYGIISWQVLCLPLTIMYVYNIVRTVYIYLKYNSLSVDERKLYYESLNNIQRLNLEEINKRFEKYKEKIK